MINRMLEGEDVEDVACTLDDMDATDRSRTLVQRGGDGVRERWKSVSGFELKGESLRLP